MTKPFLSLTAPLLLSAALGASAAPRQAAPAKPAVAVPVTAPAPQAATPGPFRDVPPGHWAAQAVETLRRVGIVQGYPSSTHRGGR